MGNHYFYEYMNHITNKLNWVGTVKLCTQMENTNSFEDHMEHYQKYPLHKPLSLNTFFKTISYRLYSVLIIEKSITKLF